MHRAKITMVMTIFLLPQFIYSSNQNYTAFLNKNGTNVEKIKVDNSSYITFGRVDKNYVLLNKINQNKNGQIVFNFDPGIAQQNVRVGLETADQLQSFYFRYNNGLSAFEIVVNGNINTFNNLFTVTDNFKIIKCSEKIEFYLNDELLLVRCLDENSADLVHKTIVEEAVNSKITLSFENDIMLNCQSNLIFQDNENAKKASVSNLPKMKSLLVNIYKSTGEFVKQVALRTDENGDIVQKEPIRIYFSNQYRTEIIDVK